MEEHPAVAGADVSGIVRQWNQYIPASAPHKREQIYIREAYPTYYDYIHQSFDLGYLIKASHDFQIEFPPLDVYDSCRWGRAVYKPREKQPANFKLSTMSEFCGFKLNHHVAIEDTFACLKIMAAIGELEIDQKTPRERSFVFRLSQFDKNDCFNFSTRLNGLTQMVQNKALLTLEYKGTSIKESYRPVRPIGLMPLPKGPVLFAECLISGMNKSFLLKKIKSFSKLEASYWKAGPP
jgi:hypothetical protein